MSLPAGFALVLDADLRRTDGGTVIIGGAPLRILRLTLAGATLVDQLASGAPVPAGAGAQRLARRLLNTGMAHPVPPECGVAPDEVTAVIPVRDREDGLRATLDALGPVGSVIVVDDGSRTPVRLHRPATTVLRHDHPRGPGAARNTGWRAASTPLVVFVDADCTPDPGWLSTLLRHFADGQVAAVAPRVRAQPAPGLIGAYEQDRSPLDHGPRPGPVRPRGRVPFVPTAALAVRRADLAGVGGFDEAMAHGEDVDFVWRLVEGGRTVRYEPASEVFHPPRPDLAAWLRQRYAYGSSAAPLARRHGNAVAPLAISGWSAAAWALVGSGYPVLGIGVAGATTALLAPRLSGLDHPWTEALRLAGSGHAHAGIQVADAIRRIWYPVTFPALVLSRRARRALPLLLFPLVQEWRATSPSIDFVRWLAMRLADDLAYGAGVWSGCVKERSLTALFPDLSSWPGRSAAVEEHTQRPQLPPRKGALSEGG